MTKTKQTKQTNLTKTSDAKERSLSDELTLFMEGKGLTLQQLNELSRQNKIELKKSKENIGVLTRTLFSPPPTDSPTLTWVSRIEKGFALYDGIMLGFKLWRRFGRVLGAFHRKKRR